VKKIFSGLFLILSLFLLSGCELAGKPDGGVYKSIDGGKTFQQKARISEEASMSNVNILSLELDPNNHQTVYVGTSASGLFRSTDGGETWMKDINNFQNITDIAIHPNNGNVIYIAAKKGSRGKVLKTEDGGQNWLEIYTFNIDGPVVASLAMDRKNPNSLYIGTSEGGILKTEDGGQSWRSLFWEKSSVRKIVFDKVNSKVIYFGTVSDGLLMTKDGGKSFNEIKKSGYVYNIAVHPWIEGTVYLSDKDGLQKSNDFGDNWEIINTLVKPEDLGSRGLDINPNNPEEIYYASARAFYKSTNGGYSWTPVQFDTSRSIEVIRVDPVEENVIYLGMYNRSGAAGIKLFP
jgi:photosystem II stability/assembly factor-like uncharacterized protein